MIPKEVQLGIKLEGIFRPHTRKRRDNAYKKNSGSETADLSKTQLRCAHYTSADAALKIIQSKRIWMRNTTCMVDYREVQHGFGIVHKIFADKSKKEAFTTALDACVPGAAAEAIKLFDQWWKNTQLDTYIACFSEHDSTEDPHGRLSMWRAFASNTARVALVFKVPWFSLGARALNLIFSPVEYLTESQAHTEFNNATAKIRENAEFLSTVDRNVVVASAFNMLVLDVVCLKHEGFKEEQEWRAVYAPHRLSSPIMESSIEVIAGIPQFIYKIPLDAKVDAILADIDFARMFDRIIIGPSPYPWVMYEAFTSALTNAGISDAGNRVFTSNIPIRTA